METVHLAPVCGALEVSRSRVEKWISDGVFTPGETPRNGKARGWTKHDVLRLACFVRLIDAGLRIEVGNAMKRLSAVEICESEFLVVLAHKRTIWRSEAQKNGPLKPVDTREQYEAYAITKEEIKQQLNISSWHSLAHILINLNDVRDEAERAWSYAASQRRAVD